MKEILNKLHLTIKEFAELYEIPYNTVRQWTVGERRMPEYLKKLIEKDIEHNTKGTQIKIDEEKEYFVKIMHVATNTTIYSRVINYKEYLEFKKNYWYVEYMKQHKGYKVIYYYLNKFNEIS